MCFLEDLQVVKVSSPSVLCRGLWWKNNYLEAKEWLPLALVMLQVCVLCRIVLWYGYRESEW